MKTNVLSTLFTAVTALGFAAESALPTVLPQEVKTEEVTMREVKATPTVVSQELAPQVVTREVKTTLINAKPVSPWFSYMRLAVSDSRPTDAKRPLPGLGVGFRYGIGTGAVDVAASYTGDDAFADQSTTYFYTLPRVSYFYQLTGKKDQTLYAGAGLAYGGLRTKDAAVFHGVIPSVSVGYELNRTQAVRSFVQLDVSQPALATHSDSPYVKAASWSLGPLAELSFGMGF